MTFDEYRNAVLAALQEEPYNLSAEQADEAVLSQPKSMRIFHENETVAEGARLIMEGWSAE